MSVPVETRTPPTTENCRFCWMCRHVCPVGHVTHLETHTPHAWALTVESVTRGQLTWNAETAEVMYACADCGLCREHCATDQPLPDAIVAARALIVEAGEAPEAVYDLKDRLTQFATPYASVAPAANTRRGAVALFVGDAAHHLAPETVQAAVRLLAASGVDVVPLGVGRSSGWLASSLGLGETAFTLAREVLKEIEESGASEVLVLSAADRWAFEYVYATRLGLTWPATVRVREVVDVLAEALSGGRLTFPSSADSVAYAYHDPCHGPRLERDGAAPRALLAAALGEGASRPLFWREGRAHPCGALGGLEFTHPAIASRLAASRLADSASAGATWLVTEDPACFHYLRSQAGQGIDVRNLYEVLAARA